MKTPIKYKDKIIIKKDFECDEKWIYSGIYDVISYTEKSPLSLEVDGNFVDYDGPAVGIEVDDSYEDDEGDIIKCYCTWFIPYGAYFCRLIEKELQLEFIF